MVEWLWNILSCGNERTVVGDRVSYGPESQSTSCIIKIPKITEIGSLRSRSDPGILCKRGVIRSSDMVGPSDVRIPEMAGDARIDEKYSSFWIIRGFISA